jgi:chromosomal replication initiation ATPase DnaA
MKSGTVKLVNAREKILPQVGDYYKTDLFARTNKREIAFSRQVAIYLFMVFTNWTLKEIASIWGFDHSTVIYANRHVRELCQTSPEIRSQIIELESKLE